MAAMTASARPLRRKKIPPLGVLSRAISMLTLRACCILPTASKKFPRPIARVLSSWPSNQPHPGPSGGAVNIGAAIMQNLDLIAIGLHFSKIAISNQLDIFFFGLSEDRPQRRDDATDATKIQFPLHPAAVGGHYKELIFYCPGPQQGLPVFPAWFRPFRRYADDLGSFQGQLAEELRKTQVVADGDTDSARRGSDDQALATRSEVSILPHSRKKMELAIAADDFSLINHIGGIVDLALAQLRQAADTDQTEFCA